MLLEARKKKSIFELDESDKYKLLSFNKVPAVGKYSKINGKMRRFLARHVTEAGHTARYTHYSHEKDAVFCLPCAMFVPPDDRYVPKSWTHSGYRRWHKITEESLNGKGIKSHISSSHHIGSLLAVENLMRSIQGELGIVQSLFSKNKSEKIKKNRILITAEIDVLRTLGKQGTAVRGHNEVYDSCDKSKNRGNLLSSLDLVRKYSPELNAALEVVEKKQDVGRRATLSMLSPQIQNDLIDVMGTTISERIIDKVKEAKYFVIIADECSVGNKVYLSMCLRYVDQSEKKIKEDFISYMLLDGADSESIFTKLIDELETEGLPLGIFTMFLKYRVSQKT